MIKNLNKVELIGQVYDMPVRMQVGNIDKLKFYLSTNVEIVKPNEVVNENQLHCIVAWGTLANQYRDLERGDMLHIHGRIIYRSFENKAGIKIRMTEIIASTIHT